MSQSGKKIVHAFRESDGSYMVALASDCPDGLPPLEMKSAGLPVGVLERLDSSAVGAYYGHYRDRHQHVFIVNCSDYPWLSEVRPRLYLAADFNSWGEVIGNSDWELHIDDSAELPKDGKAKRDVYELRIPIESIPGDAPFPFKFVTEDGIWLEIPKTALNTTQSPEGAVNLEFNPNQTGWHCFRFHMPDGYVPIGNERIVWTGEDHEETYDLSDPERLLAAATNLPLGAIVQKDRTTFRLFAPRANEVWLAYGFEADASDATLVSMRCVDGVTWEIILPENLVGAYYSFRVNGENRDGGSDFDDSFAVLDPYAKACVGNFGPGIVVDPKRFKKVKRLFEADAWQDLVILEGHVRDLTAQAPIELTQQEREGFSGLRKWVDSENFYLHELGVNAVELLPVQQIGDFLNEDYHWGYMPANYFSPESSYALAPEKASQIEEFRDLVRAFHDRGMAVIVDVVYNHVGEPYHLSYIDKHYYFHLDENNERMNWSGCGNDLRCDTPMARRLIIESLKHFVEVYDVDGFRFDLAELIGIDVLNEIEVALKKVKPSIILIAEPWSFRGHIQHELKESDFASWNDGFRESVASYVCGESTAETIQYYLSGSPESSRFVAQTINYTESHDDYCWIDRITENPDQNGSIPTWLDRRRTHLMASVLLVSLGVPMLAEGQDFMRSKLGISNTYQLGDVNALDYERRFIHSGIHAYFREWIQFRLSKAGQALRYAGPLKEGYLRFFKAGSSSAVVAVFNSDRSVDARPLIYAVNPHAENVRIQCDTDVFEDASQIADHERFDIDGLQSACISVDAGTVNLPPYSCGLWLA